MKQKLSLVKRIIKLRMSAGWSQSELSRRAGITSAALSQIEKGGRMPSLPVIEKLAKALEVGIAEIIGERDLSNNEIDIFFRKFKEINNLSLKDQDLILMIVNRLRKA